MRGLNIHSPEVVSVQKELGLDPLQALRHAQQRKLLRRNRAMLLQTPVKGDIP